jgi:hypothetical protein
MQFLEKSNVSRDSAAPASLVLRGGDT